VSAFIGLGSNLADPRLQVNRALDELARLGPLQVSSLYRSEPLGDPEQPWYVNAVARLETALEPQKLLEALQALARAAGRRPGARWGPRTLDLDLLLYADRRLSAPGLELPHPRFRERRFVLEPLAELAPGLLDPVTGLTARELLAELDDPLLVEKLSAPEPEPGRRSPGPGNPSGRKHRPENPEVRQS